ncbi:putative leader peptide [Streptomyces sp. NPDC056501]|uniref:putative leader peptide n=1 Tax=Streptomyces sp. NPDC056501 TaxID=3345841 RepID=UPI00368DB793
MMEPRSYRLFGGLVGPPPQHAVPGAVSRACRSCELRASTCPYSVDAPTPSRRDSWLMQPPRDRSVTLVQRRHVDLARVASAVCRCR